VSVPPDPWAEWLLHRRDGDDPATREVTARALARIRDKVLNDAAVAPGDAVLDVGCGNGLIGLRAAELVGPDGHVTFADVSELLLQHAADAAAAAGLDKRCSFVQSALPDLAELPGASFDVVTIRSVLIYVADKGAALAAVHRVLRPGGRLALFEPINSFGQPADPNRLWGFAVDGALAEAAAVNRAAAANAPEHATMLNFDERDLFRLVLQAGLVDVRMDYHAEIGAGSPPATDIDAFLATAPNPLASTYGDLIAAALPPDAAGRLRARLARALAERDFVRRAAVVYLAARRPGI
jgi:2-polyprenyl-3-methyl-5-hydroxy-6-metoxy-1,4-benzoquinol methylase